MTEREADHPGSSSVSFSSSIAAPSTVPRHAQPAPPSPRPVASLSASRLSLQPERERQGSPSVAQPQAQLATRISVSHSFASQSPSQLPPETGQLHARPELQQDQQDKQFRPLPPLAPLFALLTSTSHPANRQTTHHPTIRYIFADDDPEALTAALAQHHTTSTMNGDTDGEGAPADRAVVLDVTPTADHAGFEVAWASSLSADWAVVNARLSRMPGGGADASSLASGIGGEEGTSSDGAATGGEPRNTGPAAMMLQIEGVSVEGESLGLGPAKMNTMPEGEMQSSGASGMARLAQAGAGVASAAAEEYAGLVDDFEKRMGLLRRVVEAGEERRRTAASKAADKNIGVDRTDASPAGNVGGKRAGGVDRDENGEEETTTTTQV